MLATCQDQTMSQSDPFEEFLRLPRRLLNLILFVISFNNSFLFLKLFIAAHCHTEV
jgi:hypothetical protein